MEFFLDWAWNRVASIKQRADKETLLLFDHSCLEVPDTIRMTLVLQCRQLQHLKILFEEAKNLWRHGALEVVENKCSIIHLVSSTIESVQDFLIKLDIKLLMHLLEISTFSLNNVIVKLTKIMNRANKNWAHFQ